MGGVLPSMGTPPHGTREPDKGGRGSKGGGLGVPPVVLGSPWAAPSGPHLQSPPLT